MALAQLYSGSHAVDTTEWSLTTDTSGPDADTTDGIFQVFLDLSDMIAGDQLRALAAVAERQRHAVVGVARRDPHRRLDLRAVDLELDDIAASFHAARVQVRSP